MKIILGTLVLCLFLISGCNNGIICNKPYIQVGTECCLDQNSNSICDKDEPEKNEEKNYSTINSGIILPEGKCIIKGSVAPTVIDVTCTQNSDCYESARGIGTTDMSLVYCSGATQSEGIQTFKECKEYDKEKGLWTGTVLCKDKQDCYDFYQKVNQYYSDVPIPETMDCKETSFKKLPDTNNNFISCNTNIDCIEKIMPGINSPEIPSELRSLYLEYYGIRCNNNFCEVNEGLFTQWGSSFVSKI
ncbi:MAG: hypothetical protein WC413_01625 [Candidatus Nanoarchaeia archaeon]